MTRANRIQNVLSESVRPTHLEVVDESSAHNVPRGAESHFKIAVVSPSFEGLSRIQRTRLVHELLAAEFRSGLHAITLTVSTPAEWLARSSEALGSPSCHSKKE